MRKELTSWIAMSCLSAGVLAPSVQAGQLMDSILNRRNPAVAAGQPLPPNYTTSTYGAPAATYAAPAAGTVNAANYASVVSNYGPYAAARPVMPANSGVMAQMPPLGVPQTVAGYLPTATYDTQWNSTPVTYYRPVTSFDPRTGTTVTSLQPCTSVQYQAQRVPLVAPAPLLGDYGLQANRWPGITGPGYYPAGLGTAPYATGFQQVPTAGAPLNAPLGTTGTSMGMPATSLPTTTFNQSPAGMNVAAGPQVTSNFPTVPYGAVPLAAPAVPFANTYAAPAGGAFQTTVTPIPAVQGVVPAAANLPAYPAPTYSGQTSQYAPNACANGVCPAPSTNPYAPTPIYPQTAPNPSYPGSSFPGGTVPQNNPSLPAPPNIPGATVTPLGPPVYSPIPDGGLPNGGFPSSAAPSGPPQGIMPNQPILPGGAATPSFQPNGGGGGLPFGRDPEADARPSLRPPILPEGNPSSASVLPYDNAPLPYNQTQPAGDQFRGSGSFASGYDPNQNSSNPQSGTYARESYSNSGIASGNDGSNQTYGSNQASGASNSSPSLGHIYTQVPTNNDASGGSNAIDRALMNRAPVPVPPTLRPSTSGFNPQTGFQSGGGQTGSALQLQPSSNSGRQDSQSPAKLAVPLDSPEGFDFRPNWSPNLIDSDDPVAQKKPAAQEVDKDSDAMIKFISESRVSKSTKLNESIAPKAQFRPR